MLKKSIPFLILIFSIGLFLFFAARGLTTSSPPDSADIDTLKQQAIDYLKQNNLSDTNSIIKTILSDYKTDAKQPVVIYDLAEFCRNSSKFAQALELFKFIIANHKSSSQALPSQRGIVVCSIALKRLDEAKKELQILKSDYSADPCLPGVLFAIADGFYWFGFISDSNDINKEIILNYPQSNAAVQSTMGLAIASIASKDEVSAEYWTKKLISEYQGNRRIPQYLLFIANRWAYDRKYSKANEIYDYIIANFSETRTAANAKFESAKIDVFKYLDVQDEPNTIKYISNLITDFNRPDLPAVVLDMAARCDWQIGYEPNEFTKNLYKIILENFPKSSQANTAKLALDRTELTENIDINDVNVPELIDNLISTYKTNPEIHRSVFLIGERYFKKAHREIGKYQTDKSIYYFQIAVDVLQGLVNNLPVNDITVDSYYFIGNCFQNIGLLDKSNVYFSKVFEDFPEHRLAYIALYMTADNYEVMKNNGTIPTEIAAPLILDTCQRLIEKYPNCGLVRAAKSFLRLYNAQ